MDYVRNPEKTQDGKYLSSFQCSSETAEIEFLVSKELYSTITQKDIERDNVICYMLRQSFLPGEITPEKALELGQQLAMQFTGSNHQFVVAVHVDKTHVHSHIVFNSTTLDCAGKFDNYKDSADVLRAMSDKLCRENGLSVVEEPAEKGKTYKEWDATKKGTSWKAMLRDTINRTLPTCKTMEEFLAAMRAAGYEIKQGKYLSFRAPEQERFIRSKTLGEEYTVEALQNYLSVPYQAAKRQREQRHINLILDIQSKISDKGPGFVKWAKLHNLKEAAKTLSFLTGHGITSYAQLDHLIQSASSAFAASSDKMKLLENRMNEIAALKTHIFHYSKTREIYRAYQQSRHKNEFRADHLHDILLHEAAKRAFDNLHSNRLPKISELNIQYAALLEEKKIASEDYTRLRSELNELRTIQKNVDSILKIDNEIQNKDHTR